RAKLVQILRIHAEIAVVSFHDDRLSVAASHERLRNERNRHRATDERAGQSRNKQPRCIRRGFLMLCVFEAQHISGVLKNDVLKASARSEERNAFFSRDANGRQSTLGTPVGTAWADPETLELGELLQAVGCRER